MNMVVGTVSESREYTAEDIDCGFCLFFQVFFKNPSKGTTFPNRGTRETSANTAGRTSSDVVKVKAA